MGSAREQAAGPRVAAVQRYLWASLVVAVSTGLAWGAARFLGVPDVEMLFLLGVAVAAVQLGRGPSLLAAAESVAAYNFFFVPPTFTFEVSDARYFLTFAMMFAIGVGLSSLMLRLRRQEQDAHLREARTAALYALTRDLGQALDAGSVARTSARHAARAVDASVAVLVVEGARELVVRGACPETHELAPRDLEAARSTLERGRAMAISGDGPARATYVPLCVGPEPLGVMAVTPRRVEARRAEQRAFLEAFGRQVAFALERVRLNDEAHQAAVVAKTEELRSVLLSTVSHDLRTPLAVITGAATALRDDPALEASVRRDLLEEVCEEAERMERLVANLLEMTRLESGAVAPKREWVPLEEVVGAALARLERRLADHTVRTFLPDDLPLVLVDPILLEHLLVNLLENACKHTPPGTLVEVRATRDAEALTVEVADSGPGLPPGEEERIFERFHRGPAAGRAGVGLGLAIARAIAQVLGGRLVAGDRPGGGAVFRLALPITQRPPEVPLDAAPEGEA